MSLDEIRKSILSEAQSKASQIDGEGSKEAERILREVEQMAKDVLKNAENEGQTEAKRLAKEADAGAEMEANSMMLEARGEVVERSLKKVLDGAEDELSKTGMKKILEESIKQFKGISAGNFTIKTSKKNAPLLEKRAYEVDYDEIDGFMLYTDHKKIALNATVGNIVSREADNARRLIADELFGGKSTRSSKASKIAAKPKKAAKIAKKAKAQKKAKGKKKR